MVICGILLDTDVFAELKAERVRDSKKISPNRRKELSELLKKRAEKFEIVEIEPGEIDQLRGEGTNLNQIEAIGFARVLNRLNPETVYVDSASANTEMFADQIYELLDEDMELIVEHEADVKYLPVSAASIIAKVRRDERIEELKEKYGEMGSGYPADDRTIQFLKKWVKEHKELPTFARQSWKTAQRIMSENEE
ncbi:hypothetical protein AKJ53_01735 [candidate division MSBL1 archaeon SCGC-AAA382F02]|uniref:Ribonuclease n=1 Tax=candidate division MSBL1 archaeon SCGC-AAA382F02 TaxID=1698282 RepID=A0A133VHL8_9EURY|nr:hypothetical protein AKJ53_01735 [candidate division MSBL1 archaeon SCGC-AAA382F02]